MDLCWLAGSPDGLAVGQAPSARSILVATNTISPCGSFGRPGMGFGCFTQAHYEPESASASLSEPIPLRHRPAQTVRGFWQLGIALAVTE
jgi:hypothetical protein